MGAAYNLTISGSGTCRDIGNNPAVCYNPADQIAQLTKSNNAFVFAGTYNVNRPYAVNGLNQYTAAGSASFTYDANGNLTYDGSTSFLYDIENRMVGTGGARNAALRYDPLGRLYEVVGQATGTTRFFYDGDALVGEYDGNGNLLRRYVHGADAKADDPIAWYEGPTFTGTSERFLRADWEGSIVLATDTTGANVIAVNTYDEYGIPGSTNSSGTANLGRFRYTGQAWEPELGMYYYKARMYSPTLGRFMQTDPIGYKDQINLYAYVANDPVDRTDFLGLYTCSGSSSECGTISTALATIADAASKSPEGSKAQKSLQAVGKLFGSEGSKNGVSVKFTDKGFAATVAHGSSITMTFNTAAMHNSFSGRTDGSQETVENGAVVAHEGQHGVDDRARGTGTTTRGQVVQTERNAYRTQSYVNQGEGVPSAYGLWRPGISDADRTQAVNENAANSVAVDCAGGCR